MKNVILLGLVSLLTDVSSEMIYPILGLYLSYLNASYTVIGLIEGIAESISNIFKVFSGRLSDKFKNRKFFIKCGYSISTLGKIFLYFSNSWIFVLVARVIDRFGKGIRTAPRDALISESVEDVKKGKVFGLHRSMDTFGALLGIIFVYLIFFESKTNADFKKVFLLAILPSILAVLLLFFVKEPSRKEKKYEIEKINFKFYDFKYIPKKVKNYIIVSSIFAIGNSSNQFLLLKAKNLGFSYLDTIVLYLLYNFSYTLFSYPAGVLADKIGKKIIISIGYLIYSFVYFMFALLNKDTKIYIWLLFIIYGIYTAFVEGQEKAFITELSHKQYSASVLGLHYTLIGLIMLPASIIGGVLWDKIGSYSTFLFSGVVSFLSLLFFIFIV